MFTQLIAAIALTSSLDELTVGLTLEPAGGIARLGESQPMRIALSPARPRSVKTLPPGSAFRFGSIPMSGGPLMIAESKGKIWVDSNADGDFTNDPKLELIKIKYEVGTQLYELQTVSASVTARIMQRRSQVDLRLTRFDPTDPSRGDLANSILYSPDFYLSGKLSLNEKTYSVAVRDSSGTGHFEHGTQLFIDLNRDGKFSYQEAYRADDHLQIDGHQLRFVFDFDKARIRLHTVTTSPKPDRQFANLKVGEPIPRFLVTTGDGKRLTIPSAFAGRVLLVDFWSTSSSEYVNELPNLLVAYAKFRNQGFEIVGINLDGPGSAKQIRTFLTSHGIKWPQVTLDGGWSNPLVDMFSIKTVPFMLLVDGDLGTVLADGSTLRSSALLPTIEQAVKKKSGFAGKSPSR